jgi:hypothetical protein
MPEERFDISFSGQLIDGQDPAQAREQVRALFNASDAQLQRLFSGKPVVVKKGVDLESASRYRAAFRKAGALIDIRPSPLQKLTTAAPTHLDALPPNTGSLEEFAPRIEAAPLPNIDAIQLDMPGVRLDTTPLPPAAIIDTSEFAVVAGQDWSLADCQAELLPLPERDIAHLTLAAAGDDIPLPPSPPPPPLPDISALALEPALPVDAAPSFIRSQEQDPRE